MKALTIRQPWASLIAHGIKTVETRSWRTRYRGPIAIHAGVKAPGSSRDGVGDPVGDWLPVLLMNGEWKAQHYATGLHGAPDDIALPLSAVVATATLTDCVPMVDERDPRPDGPFVYVDPDFVQAHDGPDDTAPRYLEAERHLGDFQPGRWAWLLDDVKPTSERCPACWGDFVVRRNDGQTEWLEECATCRREGVCEPVPAKGRQGLWSWHADDPEGDR